MYILLRIAKFSKKLPPPLGSPHPCNPEIGPRPQNKKSALPWLFGLSTAFQNGITRPGSTKNHGPARLQQKGQGAGQGLPGGDWTGVLPTQKLLQTNLASPEICLNPFTRSKDIHDFQ